MTRVANRPSGHAAGVSNFATVCHWTAPHQDLPALACTAEAALRKHAGENVDAALISVDGKTLRGSLDRFADNAAVQWISAFARQEKIVLGHVELTGGDKGGEIGAAQELIATLELTGKLFTFDALHCQKKRPTSSETPEMTR